MNYLSDFDFSDEEINLLLLNIPPLIEENLVNQQKLIVANLAYIKDYGILNYKELFTNYYEIFLLDYSSFKDIFEKYEKEDLINYLQNNVDIIQYL